ncbi:MAG: D-sedoheptulose 7-phosphate isomerase [Bacteroidales bacterium]
MDKIKKSLNEARDLLEKMISDEAFIDSISRAATLISDSIIKKGKVISCGNGGSMSDAMHFAEEMTGKFRDERPSIPAIAISDPSHITCAGNDYGFGAIFSRFIESMGNENDVLLAISTSGNSENIVKAAEVAKAKSMKIVALTGKDGGKLSLLADVEVRIPHFGYSDRIQEMHIKVIHILIELIEQRLKNE